MMGLIKPPIPYDPCRMCIQKLTSPVLCVSATHTLTRMLIIEMNVEIKNMMSPWRRKFTKHVNRTIEMNTKMDAVMRIEWNFMRCWIDLSNKDPVKKPAERQKKR